MQTALFCFRNAFCATGLLLALSTPRRLPGSSCAGRISLGILIGTESWSIWRPGLSSSRVSVRTADSRSEHKAKNSVCFLFATVVVWPGRFQQVHHARFFEPCFKLSG